jgi:hypothetical protein
MRRQSHGGGDTEPMRGTWRRPGSRRVARPSIAAAAVDKVQQGLPRQVSAEIVGEQPLDGFGTVRITHAGDVRCAVSSRRAPRRPRCPAAAMSPNAASRRPAFPPRGRDGRLPRRSRRGRRGRRRRWSRGPTVFMTGCGNMRSRRPRVALLYTYWFRNQLPAPRVHRTAHGPTTGARTGGGPGPASPGPPAAHRSASRTSNIEQQDRPA